MRVLKDFHRVMLFGSSLLLLLFADILAPVAAQLSEDTFTMGLVAHSPATVFYQRAKHLYDAHAVKPSRLHLIRVPKAGSTAMSILTRRLAGCIPAGPCCQYPGSPPGSCPARGLMCQNVIGCVNHYPNLEALQIQSIPSILIVRNPIDRAISAFFYPSHHNDHCQGDLHDCFMEYTSSPAWTNIAVKMMTGHHSYRNVTTCEEHCRYSLKQAIQNVQYTTYVGVNELWELSVLLFHATFPSLAPQLSDFDLGHGDASEGGTGNVRKNSDERYLQFKASAREVYRTELNRQNSLDAVLYEEVAKLMCQRLHAKGLWNPYVATYWRERMTIPC